MNEYDRALPIGVAASIKRIAHSRVGGLASVSEIYLGVGRHSSIVSHGERISLCTPVSREEMDKTVMKLCDGAVYAHRDTMTRGYLSLPNGVRVGVCGQARYESGRLVGISEVSSLVFRIPTSESSLGPELSAAWESAERGMLIYAPPAGGKTTAIRTLSASLAECGLRVAVVDERCEFSPDACSAAGIVLMRGYKRADGIEIALRTLSPDIIVVDEIGAASEAHLMLESLNSGVRLLATTHSASLESLERRSGVKKMMDAGVFDVFFGIFHTDAGYFSKITRIS